MISLPLDTVFSFGRLIDSSLYHEEMSEKTYSKTEKTIFDKASWARDTKDYLRVRVEKDDHISFANFLTKFSVKIGRLIQKTNVIFLIGGDQASKHLLTVLNKSKFYNYALYVTRPRGAAHEHVFTTEEERDAAIQLDATYLME